MCLRTDCRYVLKIFTWQKNFKHSVSVRYYCIVSFSSIVCQQSRTNSRYYSYVSIVIHTRPPNCELLTTHTSSMSARQQTMSRLECQLRGQQEPDWNAVCDTMRKDPRAVARIRLYEGSTALHIACIRNAPLRVVQLMVQQHPHAIKKKPTREISHYIWHVWSNSPSKCLFSWYNGIPMR